MNKDQWEGRWNELRGKVKEHLGRLTDDDLQEAEGKRDSLLAKIQSRYGDSKDAAEKRLEELERKL
ncbi:MAG: CsbD family protein [Pseudomonadota bacterium]|nr:CsbD family protein [Pseudomonadota bacterium]HJO34798.1 CsbD family protein [Gammaproteobacteria bacterium]